MHRDTIIAGTTVICGYEWIKNRLCKKSWEIQLSNNAYQRNDVNCLRILNDRLYAGCGDSNVYLIDLENGKVLRSFEGHSEYIHDIFVAYDQLFSASQDGTIRIWEDKQKKVAQLIEPHKNKKLARPELGKWLGSVSVNNDWLLCGGGPRPALFHLRSLQHSTVYDFPKKVHVTGFVDDNLYVGGDSNGFRTYNLNGDIESEIQSCASSIYSVAIQLKPQTLISIGGSSNIVDVCRSLKYKDTSLKLYE